MDFFGELELLFIEGEGDLLGDETFPEDGFFLADVVFFSLTLSWDEADFFLLEAELGDFPTSDDFLFGMLKVLAS